MIYFDYTATTKPRKEVLDVYNKINNEYWYRVIYDGSEGYVPKFDKLENICYNIK